MVDPGLKHSLREGALTDSPREHWPVVFPVERDGEGLSASVAVPTKLPLVLVPSTRVQLR